MCFYFIKIYKKNVEMTKMKIVEREKERENHGMSMEDLDQAFVEDALVLFDLVK